MPRVDGFTFLEEYAAIRGKFDLNLPAIIVLSSSENFEDKKKALSYDFVHGYMVKGKFGPDEITAAIKQLSSV